MSEANITSRHHLEQNTLDDKQSKTLLKSTVLIDAAIDLERNGKLNGAEKKLNQALEVDQKAFAKDSPVVKEDYANLFELYHELLGIRIEKEKAQMQLGTDPVGPRKTDEKPVKTIMTEHGKLKANSDTKAPYDSVPNIGPDADEPTIGL